MVFFHFNRIFWKLFTAIWLTNIVIIILAFVVMAHGSARSKYVASHKEQVVRLAESIIDAFERKQALPFGVSRELARLKRRQHIAPGLMIDVIGANGQTVYQSHRRLNLSERFAKNTGRNSSSSSTNLQELNVESDSGEFYRVVFTPHRPPQFIREAIAGILSIQLVLMFIASAVISALISWRIVKPLKRLERFGQSFSSQIHLSQAEDSPLLLDNILLTRGDEIGDLAREIANMVEQVDKVFSAQKSLLHDVSHELRAPLARLQVAASLIEQRDPSSKYVHRVHSECGRLNALIDEILTFSHIGSSEQLRQRTNLAQLVENVVADVRFEFPSRSITCDFSMLGAEMWINAQPKTLTRVFENIIRNACKHTQEHGAIDIGASRVESGWLIACRDSGTGVDESELDKLVKPFYRGGNKMHTEGFGLGLSIAQKAIVQHGGHLTIENYPEGGLVVSVMLPESCQLEGN